MVKIYVVAFKGKEAVHSYIINNKNTSVKEVMENRGFVNYGDHGVVLDSNFDIIASWNGNKLKMTIGAMMKYM